MRDRSLLLICVALLGSAWAVGRSGWFSSGDDVSYWMAVVGGSMMLALLLYPARKYLRVMQRLGRVKAWFWMHMGFGLAGPWLILAHSTFRIGSLNAAVALLSMMIVVASGVVGRFLYVRVHRGLEERRRELHAIEARLGLGADNPAVKPGLAPGVASALSSFSAEAQASIAGEKTSLARSMLVLPTRALLVRRACRRELELALAKEPAADAADAADADGRTKRRRRSRKAIDRHLTAALQVGQYAAYVRLFALWHVAHLPFVLLLVVTAVVHVVAVHAY